MRVDGVDTEDLESRQSDWVERARTSTCMGKRR